jgi:GT2 family glycosyltransferase
VHQACDVVIVNFNSGSYLAGAVTTAGKSSLVRQIIVVDNASSDQSLETLSDYRHASLSVVRNDSNLGFGAACNIGIRAGDAEYILLLNPDCQVQDGAIERLVSTVQSLSKVGMAGPLLLNSDGTEQAGGRRVIPTPETAFARIFGLLPLRRLLPGLVRDYAQHQEPLPNIPIDVEAISGACMLVSREAVDQVGLFDERYFLHCEDLDWCVRFQQGGYRIIFVPDAKVVHEKGVSSTSRRFATEYYKHRGMVRFYRKFLRQKYSPFLFYLILASVWVRYGIVACALLFSPSKARGA